MLTVTQIVPLELLRAGDHAQICEIDGTAEFVHRLDEMGLRIGVTVRMIQPGSPCIVAAGNHRFSLRIDESAVVLVTAES
ncbi:MAG: FeoA family protein [Planctomycetaceae bacterium]